MTTKIEWTDETWNLVTGCDPISPGCANCYARRMARRLAGRYGYPDAPHHFDVTLRPDRLDDPLKWRKPRRVFVCSMGDLFHQDVPDDFILRVFDTIAITPQHTYQILTKRPISMLDWYEKMTRRGYLAVEKPDGRISDNIWLGVTAENQKTANERIPILLQIPAAVHYVSCEPMLGEIDLDGWLGDLIQLSDFDGHVGGGLDWVIVGGETGPRARPMHPAWMRSLRDQCQEAGVPFFFKKDSDGNHTLDGKLHENYPEVK